jgi:hypothetical protein
MNVRAAEMNADRARRFPPCAEDFEDRSRHALNASWPDMTPMAGTKPGHDGKRIP